MDENICLPAVHTVHTVHIVHSSLREQQLSIGDRLLLSGKRSPIDNWPVQGTLRPMERIAAALGRGLTTHKA
ncbi:MAG: hypothetical protein ACOX9E_09320 [Lentisphaeria bacterium]